MDKVLISNAQGESGIVNVIRYFQNNGKEYMIYSLNEVDESGYTRLYVTKLNGTNGTYTGEILDDNEWNEIKNLVKLIVKANKEGMPVPVQDLNPKKITNIMLNDKKVFKLNAPLVNDLGNNKPSFSENNGQEVGNAQINSQSTFGNQPIDTQLQNNPSQSPFEMPSTPSFDIPTTSSFTNTNKPINSFDSSFNTQPSFTNTNEPINSFDSSFNTQPSFNAQPTFEMPSASPVQPAFETPSFDIAGQPAMNDTNNFASNNLFDMQPASDMQTSTTDTTNNFNPSFDIPTTANETPVQPTFEMPNNTGFNMSDNQSFTTPTFEPSVQSPFSIPNTSTISNEATTDYKTMYDKEVSKNNALQDEVNKLNDELNKYKSILNNIKNVIEK